MGVQFLLAIFLPVVAAHSNLIKPKPRNAIDSELPQWKDGNAPYMWVPNIGKVATMHRLCDVHSDHSHSCVPGATDILPTRRPAPLARAGTVPTCAPLLRRACGSLWAALLGAKNVTPTLLFSPRSLAATHYNVLCPRTKPNRTRSVTRR